MNGKRARDRVEDAVDSFIAERLERACLAVPDPVAHRVDHRVARRIERRRRFVPYYLGGDSIEWSSTLDLF